MSLGSSSHDRPVIDNGLAGYADKTYEDAVVADNAIVRDVNVGHQQGVAADLCHALSAGLCAAVDRHTLTDVHIVSDLHISDLPFILKILRDGSHDGSGKHLAVLSHPDVGIYHRMRMDPATVTDLHVIINERERSDFNVVAKLRLRAHRR